MPDAIPDCGDSMMSNANIVPTLTSLQCNVGTYHRTKKPSPHSACTHSVWHQLLTSAQNTHVPKSLYLESRRMEVCQQVNPRKQTVCHHGLTQIIHFRHKSMLVTLQGCSHMSSCSPVVSNAEAHCLLHLFRGSHSPHQITPCPQSGQQTWKPM